MYARVLSLGSQQKDQPAGDKTDVTDEYRQDKTDDLWYSKADFIACYGGTDEWDKAPREDDTALAPTKDSDPTTSDSDGLAASTSAPPSLAKPINMFVGVVKIHACHRLGHAHTIGTY